MPFQEYDDLNSAGENVTIVDGADGSKQASVTAAGAVHTNLRNASGTEIGVSGSPVHVDGTVTSAPYEPATFCINAMEVALGNNKSMLAIQNTTGSSVVLKIKSIKIVNSQTTPVTGVIADFRIIRITSFSAGTTVTPQTFDTNDALSGNVSASTGATVSGESANHLMHFDWSSDEWGVGSLDNEGNDHSLQALLPAYKAEANEKPITLRANEGLTIKNVTNSTAGNFGVFIIFTQE